MILLLIIISGAYLIALTEQLPFSQALYFSFITGLTIGYGDIVATTAVGQITSIALGITGMLFMRVSNWLIRCITNSISFCSGSKKRKSKRTQYNNAIT